MTRESPGEDVPCFIPTEALPRAWGAPPARGALRTEPEDFAVEEILGFEPDGEGPHAWLQIAKRDTNTRWLAGAIARVAGVGTRDVGYAGMKDRRAETIQWFSVPVEGRGEPDWEALASADVTVMRVTRHGKKLRRGALRGNRFRLTVRSLSGDAEALAARAGTLAGGGVPNYFGPQRFGRDAGNVPAAWEMLVEGRRVRDRSLRGIYLSSARSLLFNRVLAARVEDESWCTALPGEALMLEGSHSVFPLTQPDPDVERRLGEQDLHPTGPLWGRGPSMATGEALARETGALAACCAWREGLERAGLDAARRALRVPVPDLVLDREGPDRVIVSFSLPAGAYATMVMRELVAAPTE